MIRVAGIFALSLLLLGAGEAQAVTLEKVGDFDQPTYVAGDPSNANRIFVVERKGRIKAVENGNVTIFADLGPSLSCPDECPNDRGLMSIALAPDFGSSGRLYVDYASNVDGNLHIDEFLSPGPAHATAAFARNLATIEFPSTSLHFGGQLQVGRDGFVYVSTGDGSDDSEPLLANAQNPSSLLGKIVRLDPAAPTPIPLTVWSLGLRNPFRFSFDPSGGMIVADVGNKQREEIDYAPSPGPGQVGGQGLNYGWNCREGGLPGPATDPQCATTPLSSFTSPVFEYTTHTPDPDLGGTSRCAIVGGYVIRDPALGPLAGRYIYGDYCSGALRTLQLPVGGGQASGDCSLGLKVENLVSFGEDAANRLYAAGGNGGVYRLSGPATGSGCVPTVVAKKAAAPSAVGIKAQRRRVERGKRAILTVWVSPCKGRKGETVGLLRNGHRNGSRFLSRACTANFSRRIGRGTRFAAFTRESDEYVAAKSRQLTVRIAPHRRHKRG